MKKGKKRDSAFNRHQILTINASVSMAEEMVSNFFKMSANQWLHPKYDVKTSVDLQPHEIVDGPFAQIIRYEGQLKDRSLGSSAYDFYKICLQDHAIINAIEKNPELHLAPFSLYIVSHELIHIVRFAKFLQSFNASSKDKLAEEMRVHRLTHKILSDSQIKGMGAVLNFYHKWL